MAVAFGITPGRAGAFGLAALFVNGQLPAAVVRVRTLKCVREALEQVVGLVGEWGELSAIAVAAPLTWSATAQGWRDCDVELRRRLPPWVPRLWVRAPQALPGAVGLQGPAFTWAVASEIEGQQLPKHAMLETNPKVSLALALPDARDAILACYSRGAPAASSAAVRDVVERLTRAGLWRFEVEPPTTAPELEAAVAGLTALAHGGHAPGVKVSEAAGGEIRPVGNRPLVLLESLTP